MTIDTTHILHGFITGGAALLFAVLAWIIRRVFIQRLDEIGSKLEVLTAEVHAMALQTAKDHSEVRERIARIETLTERT